MSPGLVLDTTALTHFARAGQLDALAAITDGYERIAPTEVMSEAHGGCDKYPAIRNLFAVRWVAIVELDILEIVRAAIFKQELGGHETRHLAECAVLALAESRNATAVIDDRGARSTGERHRIKVAGSLSLIARGVRDDLISRRAAATLVDKLRATDMYLPVDGPGFIPWAERVGLLR